MKTEPLLSQNWLRGLSLGKKTLFIYISVGRLIPLVNPCLAHKTSFVQNFIYIYQRNGRKSLILNTTVLLWGHYRNGKVNQFIITQTSTFISVHENQTSLKLLLHLLYYIMRKMILTQMLQKLILILVESEALSLDKPVSYIALAFSTFHTMIQSSAAVQSIVGLQPFPNLIDVTFFL